MVARRGVNGANSSGMAVAPGPLPTTTSTRKSSIARYKYLLGRPRHPVDLVEEEHLARFQAGQNSCQVVAGMLDRGAAGDPDRRPQVPSR